MLIYLSNKTFDQLPEIFKRDLIIEDLYTIEKKLRNDGIIH